MNMELSFTDEEAAEICEAIMHARRAFLRQMMELKKSNADAKQKIETADQIADSDKAFAILYAKLCLSLTSKPKP